MSRAPRCVPRLTVSMRIGAHAPHGATFAGYLRSMRRNLAAPVLINMSIYVNLHSLEGKARLAERAKPYLANVPDGAFRDLQRHRMLTIEWQPLSTRPTKIMQFSLCPFVVHLCPSRK